MTRVHFIVPPTLAFGLWLKRRALFYRFAATLLVLSYAGALTFWLFPAAPPWAASERGLIPFLANPAGVQAATSPLPTDSGPVYRLVDGNPYAAVPSLHGGYSLLVCLFVVTLAWKTRWRWWVDRPGRALPDHPDHRRRLHGKPLRRRPPDRLRLRHRRRLRGAAVLALAGMAGVTDTAVEPPSRARREPGARRARAGSPRTATR